MRLEEQVPAQTFRTQLEQVTARVEGLSNALGAHARVQVGFEAPQLVRMHYDGSLDLRPLATAGTLTLDGLRLARLQPYYAASVAGEVAGTLDASAHIDLAMTGDKLSGGLSKVKATTHEFTAGLPRETTPILRTASVQLAGGDVDLGKRRVTLGELAVRKAKRACGARKTVRSMRSGCSGSRLLPRRYAAGCKPIERKPFGHKPLDGGDRAHRHRRQSDRIGRPSGRSSRTTTPRRCRAQCQQCRHRPEYDDEAVGAGDGERRRQYRVGR